MNGRRPMVISTVWFQVAVLTFIIGFSVLGYLAYRIREDSPPIPARVVDAAGATVFTGDDVMGDSGGRCPQADQSRLVQSDIFPGPQAGSGRGVPLR